MLGHSMIRCIVWSTEHVARVDTASTWTQEAAGVISFLKSYTDMATSAHLNTTSDRLDSSGPLLVGLYLALGYALVFEDEAELDGSSGDYMLCSCDTVDFLHVQAAICRCTCAIWRGRQLKSPNRRLKESYWRI
jgi:hypothetical protein